ncbi:MAG TPA: DNA recombination protein RmuC [Candidatus Binataceae bacterium]|nr:DNA recombination protein RmuC [Candidatus Binataceae bacterium]
MAVGVAIVAALVGVFIGWLLASSRAAAAAAGADALRTELEARRSEVSNLQLEVRSAGASCAQADERAAQVERRFQEQRQLLEDAERKLSDTFKSLAADALRISTDDFLKRADEKLKADREVASQAFTAREKALDDLVRPARDSLVKLDEEIRKIEGERRGAQGELKAQLEALGSQTGRLVDALRRPAVRGRWGEHQLRNVVETAGMSEHCDFSDQLTLFTSEARFRPDMIIRLPGGKHVVVDAKAPLQAYLDSLELPDGPLRDVKLREHAGQVRQHVGQLASKAYWSALSPTPEMVVMFLPGEVYFSAALQQDSTLIEDAAKSRVVLASPTTLIALLKAIAYGWRQEHLAENAERISALGQELHERLATVAGHIAKLGGSLKGSVEAYNNAVASLETRVMPSARKFRELGVASKREIEELEPVEIRPRETAAPANVIPIESKREG